MKPFVPLLAVALVCAAPVSPALAGDVMVLGIGRSSCAAWTPIRENEALAYIYGYWSAINEARNEAGINGTIGSETDTQGIVGEVRLRCQQNPSMPFRTAILDTYAKFRGPSQDWGS